jgi:hypothetical protein
MIDPAPVRRSSAALLSRAIVKSETGASRYDLNPAILNSQFVQVALPIVLTIFIAAGMNGRAMDVTW